jgi:hypothetical protein
MAQGHISLSTSPPTSFDDSDDS